MLSTKENLKQIEMDTIQQEPLLTELTPEAAATVKGGIQFRAFVPGSTLNIRSGPRLGKNIIGFFRNGDLINATDTLRGGFRRLTTAQARAATGRAIAWVANRFLRPA
jgi:hypothetical protein